MGGLCEGLQGNTVGDLSQRPAIWRGCLLLCLLVEVWAPECGPGCFHGLCYLRGPVPRRLASVCVCVCVQAVRPGRARGRVAIGKRAGGRWENGAFI